MSRVLMVSGPATGGLRRHIDQLAERLPALGYQVAVAAPEAVRLETEVPRFNVELGDHPRPKSDLAAMRALRRAVREWKPDVIHCHGVKAALLGLAAVGWGRIPVVVTFHNLWGGGPLTIPLRALLPLAKATICVSQAIRNSLTQAGLALLNCEVIPNGIDLDHFSPAPEILTGIFTVAFVGRLTEEKGVPELLAAAEVLSQQGVGIRFVVAGDGPLREQVEVHPLCQSRTLVYLGPQSEILPVYHAAHVLAVPSHAEGLSLAALEAMACGLAVVASRVGGLPEVVVTGKTGLLVPPGDPAALAAALRQLAEHPALAISLGLEGRSRVEQEFFLERQLTRIQRVYQVALLRR
jgi:glycosyltransferase involved in cell wall biosynthesis